MSSTETSVPEKGRMCPSEPNSHPATLSPVENPNDHFSARPNHIGLRYLNGSKQQPPPAPPPPPHAGVPLPRPGNAPWGKVKGAFRAQHAGHSRPPLSSRTERIRLPLTAAPDFPEPDPVPPAVWSLRKPRILTISAAPASGRVCGWRSPKARSLYYREGCRAADERDGTVKIITKETK